MKRIQRFLVFFVVISLIASVLPANSIAVENLSINQTKNLIVGDSKLLVLTGAEPDAVTWTSSNDSVAMVNERGLVTGITTGSVTITATLKSDTSVTASVDMLIRSSYIYDVEWSGTFTSENNNTTTTTALPNDPNRIQQAWSALVGNNTIVILDDFIYTYDGVDKNGSMEGSGTLYKLDKETGAVVSAVQYPVATGHSYSYIIYADGLLYIGCPNRVMAVDPDSLALLWMTQVPMSKSPVVQFVGGCVVTNGIVLNGSTGEKIKDLEGTFEWSNGAAVDGYYYVAGTDGKIYAFDTTTWVIQDSFAFGGVGAGVMFHAGWLYWGDHEQGNFYALQVNQGNFVDASFQEVACGYITYGTPVAAGNRVYLTGYQKDGSSEQTGYGAVCVFTAGSLSLVYATPLAGAGHKIQGTPILSLTSSGGSVVAGVNAPKAAAGGVYLYFQDYAAPGTIYMLKDSDSQVTGSLTKLILPDPGDYAWEQLACDKDGALYVTNDAGFLQKYQTTKVAAPVITADLSTAEVTYGQNGTPDALTVMALSTDGGNISYQWQSRGENGVFSNISGATENCYTPATNMPGTVYYRCVITNALAGERVSIYSKVAKITVQEKRVTNGDINADGAVNAKDVTVLRRYLAGWDVEIQLAASDINRDGAVNAKDVTVLRRYLAGWDVTIQWEHPEESRMPAN